jgi:hypothetical protein
VRRTTIKTCFAAGLFFGLACVCAAAEFNPPERLTVERATFAGQTARPLRYRPDGTDFVIENGREFFNRPLYGGNSAFRADAGDRPEISLYAPGQAGNLRFGVRRGRGTLWLHEAKRVVSRYRPGAMMYEISDPLLGAVTLEVSVLGLYEAEGVIVRIQARGADDNWGRRGPALVLAYGGAGGKRGARSGDIGCEAEPVSQFFQLRPDNCRDNVFTVEGDAFLLKSKIAAMAGTMPSARLEIADAAYWDDLNALHASAGKPTERPVLLATRIVLSDEPIYFAIKRLGEGGEPFAAGRLADLYASTERQRQAIAERVRVETPDPYINAAVAALCAAADGIWDESGGSVMHGAAAWRSAYAGWRGPYANDAFGWHDRSRRHLMYWAQRQNTKAADEAAAGPDPAANLSRSHPAKQTSGDIGGKHYDMNLVYIDALLRHLLWTGDLELAERLWPVIERHFDWQKRLFRRPFGPEMLPLYEAYAAIWASDDMQFNGGGVSYTSAYNYYHHRQAAELARRLGKDAAPYAAEAELILKGMQRHLWLADGGWFGEYKDLFGLQQVHPSAGLWTFYHTLDSEVADPLCAWQMTRFVDTQIAHIPVHGDEIAEGRFFTLPTSNWMPYTYSTNNVVMAETGHTALAYWQAGRADKAFSLFKGAVLDGMYMGLCPGNAGMTTYFDAARGEAQRDFGDAVGTLSRAVVEGLFGIRPDMLNGRLTLSPGFPEAWDSAKIAHPQVAFAYARSGERQTYSVRPSFGKSVALRLIVPARAVEVERLTVNGKSAPWKSVADAVGTPRIEIDSDAAAAYEVEIVWKGAAPASLNGPSIAAAKSRLRAAVETAQIAAINDPQNALAEVRLTPNAIAGTAVGAMGHRTVFVQLKQGQMTWWAPLAFEICPAYEVVETAQQSPEGLSFCVRSNTAEAFEGQAVIACGDRSVERSLTLAAFGESETITLSAEQFGLLPGSNRVAVSLGEGRAAEGVVTNWKLTAEGRSIRWETVTLEAVFNDQVTQLFAHEYVSPRSPYCSLAIPKQGIGSWCNFKKTFEVDDRGLRQAARDGAGRIVVQGVPFATPGEADAANIAFTSQWDNFPAEITVAVGGRASHVYLLMAGSTNSMQSRFDNGAVVVTYADGQTERLALHNPTTWWPIDQDYFIDDYGFRRPEAIPPRVHLKTGEVKLLDRAAFKGKGGVVPGGAATVLDMPLRADKELGSLTVQTLANEVVVGLMSVTLAR